MDFARTGIILFTKHYDACVSFYTETLGLPVLFIADELGLKLTCCNFGGAYLMIETDGPPPAVEKSPEQNPTKLRFNVTDVEAAAKELERKGVGVRRAKYDWGTVADLVDPDGNLCQLRDEASFLSK